MMAFQQDMPAPGGLVYGIYYIQYIYNIKVIFDRK